MATIDDVCTWVLQVILAERAYLTAMSPEQREERLRKIREIELTSRLRHVIGGLNTFMSGQGADIHSETFAADIQVKFAGYWHDWHDNPQPVRVKEIEKDLGEWLPSPGGYPRFCVLFMPQRVRGYGVEGKKRVSEGGVRIFKDCISTSDSELAGHPATRALCGILSEPVNHTNTKQGISVYKQFRDLPAYVDRPEDPFVVRTVGEPAGDLVWALVLAPKEPTPAV